MTNLSNLGVTEILDGLDNKAFSAEELIVEYIKILKTKNKHNAYIHFNEEKSLNLAKESDARRAKNNSLALDGLFSLTTTFALALIGRISHEEKPIITNNTQRINVFV